MRVDLAAAFRLAVRLDLHEGVCNHFSVMLPDGKRFLLNRYGLHWSEVTASNLLALDAAGKVLEGEGEFEKTAFYIHSRIHLANPRATCVLHTHMPYATALTLLEGGRLEMVEQNALRFHDDIAYDDTYNGLVVDNAEGDRLARVLGSKRVMFLANHGVIVVGPVGRRGVRRACTTSSAPAACRCSRARMGGKLRAGAAGGRAQRLPHDARRRAQVRRRALRRRSSASSIARSRPIPAEVAVELRPAHAGGPAGDPRRSTRTTCCTGSPRSRRSRRRVEEMRAPLSTTSPAAACPTSWRSTAARSPATATARSTARARPTATRSRTRSTCGTT